MSAVKQKPAPLTPLPWEAHDVNDGKGCGGTGAPITGSGLAIGRMWEGRSLCRR